MPSFSEINKARRQALKLKQDREALEQQHSYIPEWVIDNTLALLNRSKALQAAIKKHKLTKVKLEDGTEGYLCPTDWKYKVRTITDA